MTNQELVQLIKMIEASEADQILALQIAVNNLEQGNLDEKVFLWLHGHCHVDIECNGVIYDLTQFSGTKKKYFPRSSDYWLYRKKMDKEILNRDYE